ncbi:MAG TPA: AmmeMemoRadiSam system protein B [Vicinamibacteria bacterium]|nr:AmmeMemoRadiSam system protein B [Vicinamibacteria bacterium]
MSAALRRAAFAGSWYPRSAAAIVEEVDGYLAAASPGAVKGRLIGLVSPHAGLHYSGPVAAYGYSLLRGLSGVTVVLVGPSHRAAFEGVAVHASGAWETPLGVAPIDEALAQALLAADATLFDDPGRHRDEHSLEMQMPFLQRAVAGLRIVPMLMGTQAREEVEALAAALARVLPGRAALLVASSDLSHYQAATVASRLDAEVVGDVRRMDPDALMQRLETRDNVACGGGPLVAVMKAARALGADRSMVLRYADSGDVGGDKAQVVGYMSAVFAASA